jgi:hypothetical protein
MWSLPNINRLNEEAAKNAKKIVRELKSKKVSLEKCEHNCNGYCSGEIRKYPWYDIFSDDVKGILYLCEVHDGAHGDPDEGYFQCDDCKRTFIENYTWEYYRHITDDGEVICLNCYFDRELENEENWVDKSFLKLNEDEVFARIRAAKHLIPVEGKHWQKHLNFIDNCVFDSTNGMQISGDKLQDIVRKALKQYKEVMLIMDSCFQFAVSVGCYARK